MPGKRAEPSWADRVGVESAREGQAVDPEWPSGGPPEAGEVLGPASPAAPVGTEAAAEAPMGEEPKLPELGAAGGGAPPEESSPASDPPPPEPPEPPSL